MTLLGLLDGPGTRTILVGAVIGVTTIGAIVRRRMQARAKQRLQAALEVYAEISRYLT